MTNNPLAGDLNSILSATRDLWGELKNQRIFITGGTGFFGSWLLESFVWANEALDLQASALVLTRNFAEFRAKAPHLADHPSIKFLQGDVKNFAFPSGEFSHIIHAATTSASDTFRGESPLAKFDTIVEGTRHVLGFAARGKARKFLLTSSGAVYGRHPADMPFLSEDFCGAPVPCSPEAALGEGKRVAEFLGGIFSTRDGFEVKIARCFGFIGPNLPLNLHYAIGNFIRDGIDGKPIRILGDGTPVRSYLYAGDLIIWLWNILFRGKSQRVYNVGSEEAISIADLARLVSKNFSPAPQIRVDGKSMTDSSQGRYVPSTRRAHEELGLRQTVPLAEGIKRTIQFWREK